MLTRTKAVENLMGAMSRARFEPARVDGLPVAMNMVWVVEHTTVRATPAEKKRTPSVRERLTPSGSASITVPRAAAAADPRRSRRCSGGVGRSNRESSPRAD